jgi:hypothetical protein
MDRARDLARTQGLTALLKRAFDFYVFHHGRYYLYEHDFSKVSEAEFLPRVDGLTLEVVHSNDEADELAKATGEDFRRWTLNARRGLDSGAVFFCFLVNGELAHFGSVAMSGEAMTAMGSLPVQIDFSDGLAYTGGTETLPKFQRRGLMVYGYFKRFEYLREKGFRASRNGVSVENVASQKAHARFGPKIYAEARYVKLLGWEFWKETPISAIDDGALPSNEIPSGRP